MRKPSPPPVTTNIAELIEQLKDQDFKVSQKAEQRLIELNDPASFPPLVEVLKGEDVCNCQAANILLELRGNDAIPDVLEAMAYPPWWDDQDGMVAIVGGYLDSAGKTASAALVSALNNPDAKIRQVATWALESVRDAGTIPALVNIANTDPDMEVRQGAVSTLLTFQDLPDYQEKVIQAMNPEAQSLMNDIIARREQRQRDWEALQKTRARQDAIHTVISILLLAGLFIVIFLTRVK